MAMILLNEIAQRVQNVKDVLNHTVSQTVNTVTAATHQAVDTVTTTTEQAKVSFDNKIQQAENLGGVASETIQNAILSLIRDWINAHPKIFWLVSHPFLALVIVLFAILILWGFLKALGSLFEKAWLTLLQALSKFGQLVFRLSYQYLNRLTVLSINKNFDNQQVKLAASDLKHLSPESSETESPERLTEIVKRLEAINQEQKKLLQEVAAILDSDKMSPN